MLFNFLSTSRLIKQINTIKGTEGYSLLTPYQRRLIKNFLYLEMRSHRFHPLSSRYKLTHNIHQAWFCHATVYAIEYGIKTGLTSPPESFPLSFFESPAPPTTISSLKTGERLLTRLGFPAVLQIGTQTKNEGRSTHVHSCLVLGHDKKGNLIMWEKEGYSYPFRIVNLKQQLKEYTDFFWSVRPLRNTQNDKISPFI